MTWFALFNNGLSCGLIAVCWWLAHQNSLYKEPFARVIATGYSLLAMAALSNMLFRFVPQLSIFLPWSILCSKAVLVFTLGMVAWRLAVLNRIE